jgi:predicted short-subunit dehydrogenase-like oxidoreductase (DUF2520 family)
VPDDVVKSRIVLVGPGRVGRAFARSWTGAGGSIVLFARDAAGARAFAASLPRTEVQALDEIGTLAGDILVLSVPDDAIRPLAERLGARVACRFAFHFSGALGSRELAPLSSAGAKLGSLHPLRAFSGAATESWESAFVAVEGEEPAATVGERLCRHAGARPHRLAAADKPLYHAAATLAAGGAASLLSLASRLWVEAGLSEDEGRTALAELSAGAVDAVGRLPFDRVLTGPVARRDVETVRLHRDALRPWPEQAALYALLARETLRRTAGRGREEEIGRILAPDAESAREVPVSNGEESDNPRRKG